MNCSGIEYGAGILAVFDNSSTTAVIQVRDGFDFAFSGSSTTQKKTTVAQTFTFTPQNFSRVSKLTLFVADCEASRPDRINIRTRNSAGATLTNTNVDNTCVSSDGNRWDTLEIMVTIPAKANRVRVQIQSVQTSIVNLPDSLIWIVGAPCRYRHTERPGGTDISKRRDCNVQYHGN